MFSQTEKNTRKGKTHAKKVCLKQRNKREEEWKRKSKEPGRVTERKRER